MSRLLLPLDEGLFFLNQTFELLPFFLDGLPQLLQNHSENLVPLNCLDLDLHSLVRDFAKAVQKLRWSLHLVLHPQHLRQVLHLFDLAFQLKSSRVSGAGNCDWLHVRF